jgi:hypothetical protein
MSIFSLWKSENVEWGASHADYIDPLTDLKWTVGQFKNPPWHYGYCAIRQKLDRCEYNEKLSYQSSSTWLRFTLNLAGCIKGLVNGQL